MMDRIRGSEIFTKFDLKSGYNQIRIRPGDEWKTTFMTPFGPYRMRVMTFGFTNAPPCFQRYMDKVFAPLLYKNLENYLDDALNHHKSEEEHVKGVRDTLLCLREAKLFCNPKKCEFHQKRERERERSLFFRGYRCTLRYQDTTWPAARDPSAGD